MSDDHPQGRITGVGGIFVKSRNPQALAEWCRDVLGLEFGSWGGATLRNDAPQHPPAFAWNAVASSEETRAPSSRDFMINLAVSDLEAITNRLWQHGVVIIHQDDSDCSGRFAWLLDPYGTKIDLWQQTQTG